MDNILALYTIGLVIAFVLLVLQGTVVGWQGLKGTSNPYFSTRFLKLVFSVLAFAGAGAVGFTLNAMYFFSGTGIDN